MGQSVRRASMAEICPAEYHVNFRAEVIAGKSEMVTNFSFCFRPIFRALRQNQISSPAKISSLNPPAALNMSLLQNI